MPDGELAAMGAALRHRGPDGCGEHREEGLALGCRRLSLVDVDGGWQPFLDESRSIVMVCNGEIYNHRELRDALAGRHRFRSGCDVEVIVHLYEERGMDLLEALNGQFAFALYDGRERTLFLARDQFGICPLYFSWQGDRLLFASEVKAILRASGAPPALDLRGLDQALSLPSVVSPRTMFAGVSSLPAGHYLRVDAARQALRQYWDLVYPAETDLPATPAEPEAACGAAIRDALRAAVRRRLQSERPIGLYVSGGLDSALVAALAAAERHPLVTHTLSVGFPQAELDESGFQRLVAGSLPYEHRQVQVSVADVAARLEEAVWRAEVPMRESYDVASLLLAETARAHGMSVVLSGEGSDELFAGYSGYRFDSHREGRRRVRPEAVPAVELEARAAMWGDPAYGYDLRVAELRERKRRLYSADAAGSMAEFDCTATALVDGRRVRSRHLVHKRSYLDVKLRLADHLLGDHGDRMTLASSVEGRYPFLDRDFVRLAVGIPPSLKLRDFEEKWILRRAAQPLIPPPVSTREKFPFTAPASPYLVREAGAFVRDWLAPDLIRRQGFFNAEEVQRLVATYQRPDYQASAPLATDWLMLVLTFTMLHDRFRHPVREAAPAAVVRTGRS
jgi:asparagine synthase (glutamine-hydrolysing)